MEALQGGADVDSSEALHCPGRAEQMSHTPWRLRVRRLVRLENQELSRARCLLGCVAQE